MSSTKLLLLISEKWALFSSKNTVTWFSVYVYVVFWRWSQQLSIVLLEINRLEYRPITYLIHKIKQTKLKV